MKNLLSLFVTIGILALLTPFFVLTVPGASLRFEVEAASSAVGDDVEPFAVPEPTPLAEPNTPIPEPTEQNAVVRVPVLMYHHIRPMQKYFNSKERLYTVTPERFEEQIRSLLNAGFIPITPAEFEDALVRGPAVLPDKPFMVTLDDGFRDQYEHALPILKRLNTQATFFVVSEAHRLKGNMTEHMIKEIDESGIGTIAAHTENHAFLAKVSEGVRWQEIYGSKEDLETLLGHAVHYFAYPYGSWSPAVAHDVERAGFHLGFGVETGVEQTRAKKYRLHRIRVTDQQDITDFVERLLKKAQDLKTQDSSK